MSLQPREARLPRMPLRTATDVMRAQRELLWNAKGVTALGADLTTNDLVVLNKLVLHAGASGETTVRVARIARDTKLGVRTVWSALARLRELGLVASETVQTRSGRSNVYRLLATREQAGQGAHEPLARVTEALDAILVAEEPTTVVTKAPADLGQREEPAPESFEESCGHRAGGSCSTCTTHRAAGARPPPATPSSDRSQINDPPLPPGGGGGRFERRSERAERTKPSSDTVSRVLAFFLAKLWPHAVGPSDTRDRRRYVLARLEELEQGPDRENAERVLLDAVLGARLHPWHRQADLGYHARLVFRDLDKVEELAALGRRKRLAEEREERAKTSPPERALSRPASIPGAALPLTTGHEADDVLALLEALEPTPSARPVGTKVAGTFADSELAELVAVQVRARQRAGVAA